jgi:hypothetical protein
MNAAVTTAGVLSLLLAAGHTLVGRVWVLDRIPRDLGPTPFGDGSLTRSAVLFTWDALALMLTTMGALLIVLGGGDAHRSRDAVLLVIGGGFACATLLLWWMSRRRPSNLVRAPVWVFMVAITTLCWLSA